MSNIEKLKFHILEMSRNNYLSWYLDIELDLQRHCLTKALVEKRKTNENDQVDALIFIRRHLLESMNNQYLSIGNCQPYGKG